MSKCVCGMRSNWMCAYHVYVWCVTHPNSLIITETNVINNVGSIQSSLTIVIFARCMAPWGVLCYLPHLSVTEGFSWNRWMSALSTDKETKQRNQTPKAWSVSQCFKLFVLDWTKFVFASYALNSWIKLKRVHFKITFIAIFSSCIKHQIIPGTML